MPPSTPLPLACAVNESYVVPLAVMLDSLKRHLRPDHHPRLYLLHSGLSASDLGIISSLIETIPILLTAAQLDATPHAPSFPREASAPLLLPDLLPAHLERILFLDADMLVFDDLAKLWQTPLEQSVVAAVRDMAVPDCSAPRAVKGWQTRGIPPGSPYFNAGMLIIDLPRWRERDVTSRAHHYLQSATEPVDFLHQEALNAVIWNDWKCLDPRWNLLASCAGRPFHLSDSEAWRHPGIVHFAGRMKPWRAPIGGPFNEPYQLALRRIVPLIPTPRATWGDSLCSFYDRRLRSTLYPLEQYLWRHRLL